MPQLEYKFNGVIKKHLCAAVDNLQGDSNYISKKDFQPLVEKAFLSYSYSCNFLQVRLMNRGVVA